ncbi:hypothetical protein OHA25_53195 [Nonomuraea sp. NBC_00507]|uniref:hypothetical protein n=1 Tax=Nonomuraea sp. NBC_00507 TaxID=2976002 RepID=UPI002E17A705
MPRLTDATVWILVLAIAGAAAAGVCHLTSPVVSPGAPRDFFDSPFLLLAFLGLAVVSGMAAWFVPQGGLWWGLLAASPFYVLFLIGVVREGGGGQGLWPVGLLFLIFYTAIPVIAALAVSFAATRVRS